MAEKEKPVCQHRPPRKDPPLFYTENAPLVNRPGSVEIDACEAFEKARLDDK